MTVVLGTAGHIDHGKTALLRALTGIDADRLPEERRRGMTIDVGYAHLTLPNGAELDFVDVPGHDRLVGNMLVGAGEIDAIMLIVAADEGPQAQTLEHLALLDALGIDDGLAVLTKLDLLEPSDPRRSNRPAEVRALLAPTRMAGIPIVAASAVSGEGVDELRGELLALEGRVAHRAPAPGGTRLAVDRSFVIRGRGIVVTGSLRGGAIETGDQLRLEPGGRSIRVRGAEVHGTPVDRTPEAGRVALNVAGLETSDIRRGMALVAGPAVRGTTRLLVTIEPAGGPRPLADGAEVRLHLGTAETLARVRLPRGAVSAGGRDSGRQTAAWASGAPVATAGPTGQGARVAALILSEPVPAALDDRFVLRWPSPADVIGGGRVIDPMPPARLVRRRLDGRSLTALARTGTPTERFAAHVRVHGVLSQPAGAAVAAALGGDPSELAASAGIRAVRGRWFEPSVLAAGELAGTTAVDVAIPAAAPLTDVRQTVERAMRHAAPGAGVTREDAADIVAALVTAGALERDGDGLRRPGSRPARSSDLEAAMARLEAALDLPQPPPLAEAARLSSCPPEGVRDLVAEGRIVQVGSDLAYASETFARMEAVAVELARRGPVTPAAFRDATGTSRKYALAILEELDGRGLLRRGPDGHQLGPKAPQPG